MANINNDNTSNNLNEHIVKFKEKNHFQRIKNIVYCNLLDVNFAELERTDLNIDYQSTFLEFSSIKKFYFIRRLLDFYGLSEFVEKMYLKYAHKEEDAFAVIKHVYTVLKSSELLIKYLGFVFSKLDALLIILGSLFHDIARPNYAPGHKNAIKHGYLGFKIILSDEFASKLRRFLLPVFEELGWDFDISYVIVKKLAHIARNHVGFGITREDIIEHNLPLQVDDYLPKNDIERFIALADNLVFYDKIVTLSEVFDRFRNELSQGIVERGYHMVIDLINSRSIFSAERKDKAILVWYYE